MCIHVYINIFPSLESSACLRLAHLQGTNGQCMLEACVHVYSLLLFELGIKHLLEACSSDSNPAEDLKNKLLQNKQLST